MVPTLKRSVAVIRFPIQLLLILTVIAAFNMQAQVTKVGTTSAKFLSVPVGARALGMGGAFVAVANDASAMFWNPAGLSSIYQYEAIFSHSQWLADIDFNYGGIVVPAGDVGTIGVNFTSLTMDQMERTTELSPDGTGEFFFAGSFSVGIAYAKTLTDWFSIGGNVKYIHESIWNSSATGFGIDIGTLFVTPLPSLKFGAGISNFGTKMQITGEDLLVQNDISPNNGNNPNVNAELSTDRFDIPLTLRIGFAYAPISDPDAELLFVVDAIHPNDNTESVSIGGEYSGFGRVVALRAGYRSLGQADSEEQFTIGTGLRYDTRNSLILKFDYAYEQYGRFTSIHKFTFGILF